MGGLSLIINTVSMLQGDYFESATGLLFAFTYLYIAINDIWNLDKRPFGWYSLFVAINAVILAGAKLYIGDIRFAIIWLLWAVLWFAGFIEIVMKKDLGKFVPYLSIFEGIATAWIPSLLMLMNLW